MGIICRSFLILLTYFAGSSSLENATSCGMRKSLNRIVGGKDTGGYHYPWFALLVLKENEDYPVCAGSLITTRHVLTAAHCFFITQSTPKEELFTVLMGVYDRCNHNDPERRAFGVSRVDVHEEYLPRKKFHDIALMTLAEPAEYTIICLPSGFKDESEPAILIGFGVTKEGGRKAPCRMREAHVIKYSKRECKRTELPEEDVSESSVICAGKIRGGVDSCQGDSGGPLQTVTKDGRFIIQGIVSFGYGCANPGLPGLYTNVASYLNWMYNKISAGKTSFVHENHYNHVESLFEKRHGFRISFPAEYPHSVRFPSGSRNTTKTKMIQSPTVNFPTDLNNGDILSTNYEYKNPVKVLL